MKRSISYPIEEYLNVNSNTRVTFTHTCYEGYRGYNDEEQRQFAKRIVVDESGKIKKGPEHITLENEVHAPTDYKKTWDVELNVGDYIIMSIRTALVTEAKVTLEVEKVVSISDHKVKCKPVKSLTFMLESFDEKITNSKYHWHEVLKKKLHKGAKAALTVPKKFKKWY